MWGRISTRAAHLAAEHLPVGARTLVVGTGPPRRVIDAFKKRGMAATAVPALPEQTLASPAGKACVLPWDLLVLEMNLSEKSVAERHAVPGIVQSLAPLALLVDWQRAERNLEIPAEGLRRLFFRLTASCAKRGALAAYDASGGLEGVVYEWRRQGRVVARQSCLGGCVGMALIAWKQRPSAVE